MSDEEQPMIEFKNVVFGYNEGTLVLKDISFKVAKNETLVILGVSGSGKSTILRLLLGLNEVDSGTILLDGEDVTKADSERLVEIRKKIGMIFQEGALFDSLTVGENVGYFLLEHGYRGRRHMGEVEERVKAMLAMVKLEQTIDMMPSELSGGMRRRISTARSLIYEPAVVLYDEPTTGLDPAIREDICNLINDVNQASKVAAIVVTHNLEDAFRVGNRFMLLREGKILWMGPTEELKKHSAEKLDDFFKNKEVNFSLS
jgi:phospholipid/cholesterol/gamma-HCH transport system ATP-binding protein